MNKMQLQLHSQKKSRNRNENLQPRLNWTGKMKNVFQARKIESETTASKNLHRSELLQPKEFEPDPRLDWQTCYNRQTKFETLKIFLQ